MDTTEANKLQNLEGSLVVLATALGMCMGERERATGKRDERSYLIDVEAKGKAMGVPTDLLEAFLTGARIAAEPPPGGGGLPVGKGLRRNIEAMRRKAA